MEKLDKINAKQKYGNEYFTFNGNNLGIKLLDYWKWSSSNLLSNAIRGMFAEFIVSMAMEINFSSVRKDWKPYDIETKEGIKIEVKTSAYLQSWFQKNYSKILFSIKPARYWDTETNIFSKEKSRHSDIYIFCVLKHKDKDTVDPLNLDQWDFYVIPTKK